MASFLFCWSRGVLAHPRYLRSEAASISTKDGTHSVCDRDPDHILAHFYRGESLNRLGRVDDALEMLERASHLQPDRARVYYLLGILYDKKNLKHEAGLMYRKARELTDR